MVLLILAVIVCGIFNCSQFCLVRYLSEVCVNTSQPELIYCFNIWSECCHILFTPILPVFVWKFGSTPLQHVQPPTFARANLFFINILPRRNSLIYYYTTNTIPSRFFFSLQQNWWVILIRCLGNVTPLPLASNQRITFETPGQTIQHSPKTIVCVFSLTSFPP